MSEPTRMEIMRANIKAKAKLNNVVAKEMASNDVKTLVDSRPELKEEKVIQNMTNYFNKLEEVRADINPIQTQWTQEEVEVLKERKIDPTKFTRQMMMDGLKPEIVVAPAIVEPTVEKTMFDDAQLQNMLGGGAGMINIPDKKTIENQQSEAEKIMFANQPMPEKDYGDRPQEAAPLPPIEGKIPNYKYKDDEIDEAFQVDPQVDPTVKKLDAEFEQEMASIERSILEGKTSNLVGAIQGAGVVALDIKAEVDRIIDMYLDAKEAKACMLYAEAVEYELRFIKPILEKDQKFFREIEDMGFVKIALMVKSLGLK